MHKPTKIQIGITEHCNLRCRNCNLWNLASLKKNRLASFFLAIRNGFAHRKASVLRKEELSDKEWIHIITSLKEWLGPYTLGITGGEPFLRKDLVDIIRFCHENEIRTIVDTNATLFTPESIIALSGLHTLTLNISLDGSTPLTHDYLRGVRGTYQKVMDVLQQFNSLPRRCHITIATILMGYNCEEILDIIKLSHERKLADGIIFHALNTTPGVPYEEAWFHKNRFWPKGDVCDRLIDVIEELIALKGRGVPIWNPTEQLRRFQEYFTSPDEDLPDPCASGENNFIINSVGDVLLCWKISVFPPLAHFSKGPAQIWESVSAQERRQAIRACRRTCKILNCYFKYSS